MLCVCYDVCLLPITCVIVVRQWYGIIISGCLMYVIFGECDFSLRVFDLGHLLVVRVGNLNELTLS